MATMVRSKLSKKNKYYVEKHRYYELKHYCFQYKEWQKRYMECCEAVIFSSLYDEKISSNKFSDPTAKYAVSRVYYKEKIDMVERIARETDPDLYQYILKGVTEGVSYNYLRTRLDMPCSKDTYYNRYRKFFWLLNKERD